MAGPCLPRPTHPPPPPSSPLSRTARPPAARPRRRATRTWCAVCGCPGGRAGEQAKGCRPPQNQPQRCLILHPRGCLQVGPGIGAEPGQPQNYEAELKGATWAVEREVWRWAAACVDAPASLLRRCSVCRTPIRVCLPARAAPSPAGRSGRGAGADGSGRRRGGGHGARAGECWGALWARLPGAWRASAAL